MTTTAEIDPLALKDMQLHEANHRIKNSLQRVASVLRLQATKNTDNPFIEAELKSACQRINTIAKIHDQFCEGDQPGEVDFAAYLKTLCEGLKDSFALHDDDAIRITATRNSVPTQTAMSLGLIVNKHAFAGDLRTRVHVIFLLRNDCSLELLVADNGQGLSVSVDNTKSEGLGMKLVESISLMLGPECEIDTTPPGVRFRFLLPVPSGHCHTGMKDQ